MVHISKEALHIELDTFTKYFITESILRRAFARESIRNRLCYILEEIVGRSMKHILRSRIKRFYSCLCGLKEHTKGFKK